MGREKPRQKNPFVTYRKKGGGGNWTGKKEKKSIQLLIRFEVRLKKKAAVWHAIRGRQWKGPHEESSSSASAVKSLPSP